MNWKFWKKSVTGKYPYIGSYYYHYKLTHLESGEVIDLGSSATIPDEVAAKYGLGVDPNYDSKWIFSCEKSVGKFEDSHSVKI
jgi:hypothetical protein